MNGSATSRISMAERTRVMTPARSSASCSAMALITVASIPMWSAEARSMPAAASDTPRKKFPPPTTAPTWVPRAWTPLISVAR